MKQFSLIYILSLLLIFIFYPAEFKLFYLSGVQLLFIILAAMFLSRLWLKKKLRLFLIILFFLLFWFNLRPDKFLTSLKQNFTDRLSLGSLYRNQLEAVDWIYQDAAGQGFQVYIFVPPIYDYNYQYLFFWRGLNRYGYLPAEFSYAPAVPQYVPKKELQLERVKDKIKPASGLVYFLIDNKGSVQEKSSWRFRLSGLRLEPVFKQIFPSDTIIEKYRTL